ncbi:WD40 repeat-like protein [Amniculicola lignicola CBS 123094]|uniref:WD40 repeat-like protein n=1 Tax=Amniculicola lignicola CBS 123094 TaxID=1392246 RepID=A0A6A5WLG7_9PLEO|nr:WD40 repeat-like protein [Amniculicola lignicola CBS 123094]
MSSPRSAPCGLDNAVSDFVPSSPPQPVSSVGGRKVRKPPPITPKRFTRFFTPRNSRHGASDAKLRSSSARQLQDITRTAVNRNPHSKTRTTPRKTVNFAEDMEEQGVKTPQFQDRKRKGPYLSPESSPAQSSPSKRPRYMTPPSFSILEDEPPLPKDPEANVDEELSAPVFPTAIRRLRGMGSASRILQRSFGGSLGIGRGFARDHSTFPQDQTANFYSSSSDFHQLSRTSPPICVTGCNNNTLVAVGDEEGWITLLDSDTDPALDFSKAHMTFKAHQNAIMDVQFSHDDMYMATGSGDQTAQILDVRTQQTVAILAKHLSSVKQVRFKPDDDNTIATSSRDGAVHIWDLRCKGSTAVHSAWGPGAPYASSTRSMPAAHAEVSLSDILQKNDGPSRRGEASVTSLSFLPDGRDHLLLTASDVSTSIKLWDIRGRYSLRGPALPVSTTRQPESHTRHRHFAVNSLTLNGDATRLYALSKDNTVYAYSTSHLILGVAPELSIPFTAKQRYCQVDQQGLGPLYGFRHRKFHAGSFYVKSALRRADGDQPEMLAVGSTDGCPVLFPTDETFLKKEPRRPDDDDDLPVASSLGPSSRLRSRTSGGRFPSLLADTIPIYQHGTPLIRGHNAEVGSVAWSTNGTLISIGDDQRVRRWQEGKEARELRMCGETEGKRWQAGWAVVQPGYDDEDE